MTVSYEQQDGHDIGQNDVELPLHRARFLFRLFQHESLLMVVSRDRNLIFILQRFSMNTGTENSIFYLKLSGEFDCVFGNDPSVFISPD